MERSCDSCAATYDAKRPTSRFCSPKCRTRSARGQVVSITPAAPIDPSAGVTAATRSALATVDRESTLLGQSALALAARIDSQSDTGSALASLVKQLQATFEAATVNTATVVSALDELRLRREQRRGA